MRIVNRVEPAGCITLSFWDKEKVYLRITEITELNIMENSVILSMKYQSSGEAG